jgi:hypothetical protein
VQLAARDRLVVVVEVRVLGGERYDNKRKSEMIKTAIAAAVLAGGLAVAGAAPASASCSYFGANESAPSSQGICKGGISISQSIQNASTNLKKNLSLTGNLNVNNLKHALTHGVGTDG